MVLWEYVCTHVQYLYNVCMCHVGMHVVRCVLHIILNECVRECNCVYMCASSVPVQYTWHVRGCEMHWLHVYEVHACTVLMEACWGGTITNASLTTPPNMLPSALYMHGPRTHVASASHTP